MLIQSPLDDTKELHENTITPNMEQSIEMALNPNLKNYGQAKPKYENRNQERFKMIKN